MKFFKRRGVCGVNYSTCVLLETAERPAIEEYGNSLSSQHLVDATSQRVHNTLDLLDILSAELTETATDDVPTECPYQIILATTELVMDAVYAALVPILRLAESQRLDLMDVIVRASSVLLTVREVINQLVEYSDSLPSPEVFNISPLQEREGLLANALLDLEMCNAGIDRRALEQRRWSDEVKCRILAPVHSVLLTEAVERRLSRGETFFPHEFCATEARPHRMDD